MLPGLCRTNTALLLQTCPILDESPCVGTLISMLNQGFGTRRQGFEPSRAWGLGHQAPFMRTEVATTKPKRKLGCFDATRLIQTRLPGLCTGNQLVQQADVARTVSGPCLGWVRGPSKAWGPGPQGLGAQAPSGLLAGYYAPLSCKGKKRAFSPSPLLKPSNTPPKVGGGFRVSYD